MALPGATSKVAEILKFPRKEERKREKGTEGRGKEGKQRKEEERKKERTVKEQNGVLYWERRRKCVKREMKMLGLLLGRKISFWALFITE